MADENTFLAITILFVVCPYLYREHIAPLRHAFRRSRVRDAACGLAELTLPAGWHHARPVDRQAGIDILDPGRGRHLIVISDSREDFDASLTLEQYSADTRATMTSELRLLTTSGPVVRRVGGLDAIQFEIHALDGATEYTYLHTAVLGKRAFHQVVGWSPRRRYSRLAFDRLIDGFQEPPAAASPGVRAGV